MGCPAVCLPCTCHLRQRLHSRKLPPHDLVHAQKCFHKYQIPIDCTNTLCNLRETSQPEWPFISLHPEEFLEKQSALTLVINLYKSQPSGNDTAELNQGTTQRNPILICHKCGPATHLPTYEDNQSKGVALLSLKFHFKF